MSRSKRLSLVAVSAAIAATVAVGCGSGGTSNGSNSSSGSSSSHTSLTLWSVDSGLAEKTDNKLIARYNKANPNAQIQAQYIAPNPYLQKFQIAMGAKKAPTIFMNWGGGRLESYIKAGDVLNLTPYLNADPSWKNKYLPSVMKSVTFNGKIYGIPYGNMQPVNFFYNKKLFQQYNLTPPKTWDDLLSDVRFFKSKGIIPIALGGKDNWPDLMYFEYLVDRLGGQQPYNDIAAGKAGSWSNPVITKALTMMQQLVKAGAFEPGFSSVGSGDGSDAALLYSGKAAMWLMGSWGYGAIKTSDSSFMSQLGWFPFPAVPGGKGNPADVCGNPSDYYSIPTSASQQQVKAAINFLKNYNLDSDNVKDLLAIGYVPAVKGIESQLKQSQDASYETFYYNLAKNAPYYQQSWDTALPAAEGNELDTDLGKLLAGQMSISQFETDMNTQLQQN
ncbi:extracellular solute-binding protein [Alicyclobacillus kakegawensis]|uniref:extracellular solute-binding protein n=1 Tax=Alicyclobacillus kakegawensis TaxID=392012 RepID=UPI0008325AB0|nr:extracellular solute-binding protein [Alicyclobacillus kakegawensis]